MESRCVLARENRGSFLAVYIARVRITVQPEERPLFARVMALARAGGLPPARSMTSHSRPQKPTPPNARWRLSEDRLGLSFIARTRTHRCDILPTVLPVSRRSPGAAACRIASR